jgi:hypothetical protein
MVRRQMSKRQHGNEAVDCAESNSTTAHIQEDTINRIRVVDWRKSDARAIVLRHLEEGLLSLDENEVSAETAWRMFKEKPQFKHVEFDQFKLRLRDHRKQIQNKREKETWNNSTAKQIILSDLEKGEIQCNETVENVWLLYKSRPELLWFPLLPLCAWEVGEMSQELLILVAAYEILS